MAGVRTLAAEPDAGYALTVVDLDPLRAAICAAGELDLAARQDLIEVLQHQEDERRRFVRLDVSQVTFLDCSCLGVIASSHDRLIDLHGLLVLSGVDGCVARILKITGLDHQLFVVPADEDPFGQVQMARAAQRRQRSTTRHPATPSGQTGQVPSQMSRRAEPAIPQGPAQKPTTAKPDPGPTARSDRNAAS